MRWSGDESTWFEEVNYEGRVLKATWPKIKAKDRAQRKTVRQLLYSLRK